MNTIDFTKCPIVLSKAYGGANGKKVSILYNDEVYMLKFPPSAERKPTELSYTNSCISEHIGSSIFNMLGIEAQKTLLGTYIVNGKEKVVCACKDFAMNGSLYDFCAIKNTIIDSEHLGAGTELEDILEAIEKQQFVSPAELTKFFWDMFIADALIGNFDRHNGNWGFLVGSNNVSSIAPVFDCGSSMLPQADESTIKKVLSNEDELNARIYQFPTSAIKLDDKKINYYDFLTNCDNDDCIEALKRITNRIDIDEITRFINSIPCITDLQKQFYTEYITARYEKIIIPAYNMVMDDETESEGFSMDMQ